MFLTFDLGPDGKGKIPVAQVKSLLDNNRFNVQFDDYQRRGQKTLDVIKQESICYFNNVRLYYGLGVMSCRAGSDPIICRFNRND